MHHIICIRQITLPLFRLLIIKSIQNKCQLLWCSLSSRQNTCLKTPSKQHSTTNSTSNNIISITHQLLTGTGVYYYKDILYTKMVVMENRARSIIWDDDDQRYNMMTSHIYTYAEDNIYKQATMKHYNSSQVHWFLLLCISEYDNPQWWCAWKK